MKKSDREIPGRIERSERGLSSDLPSPEILDRLPEDVRASVIEAASFSGPLPPPSMFRSYEEILPGAAERILTIVEQEQRHRMGWEEHALKASTYETRRAQWMGTTLAAICIAASVFLAIYGQPAVASIVGGVTALGVLTHLRHRPTK